MRILFMGTAELACPCLEALAKLQGHELVGVVTQPDRPKGRDLKSSPPPVKIVADGLGLPVHQPMKIREAGAVEQVRAARPDVIVVVAYGQILPKTVLDIPARGCINLHTSLLPRWRGAAPIQYAILHGDPETGVTTMFMDEHMDTGDIILQRSEPIHPDDTSATLHDRLAMLGAATLVETVNLLAAGQAPRTKQDQAPATYAKKLTKEDGRIDWTKPAAQIERQVRAFDPWPGAYTFLDDLMLKVWKVEAVPQTPGTLGQANASVVTTSEGALKLIEVQPAGGKRMSFDAFARGHKVADGCSYH
jgi:methionyl-tRNA formyltransferase